MGAVLGSGQDRLLAGAQPAGQGSQSLLVDDFMREQILGQGFKGGAMLLEDLAGAQRYTERALACLTPREAAIICRRFGLYDRPAETLEQISCDLHISRERVRQIATEALDKLKQHEAMLLACAEQ